MIEIIDVDARKEITFKGDKDPLTVVIIRPLSGLEMMEVFTGSSEGANVKKLLLLSIVEVKNFPQAETPEEAVNRMTTEQASQVIDAVNKINHLTAEEIKN